MSGTLSFKYDVSYPKDLTREMKEALRVSNEECATEMVRVARRLAPYDKGDLMRGIKFTNLSWKGFKFRSTEKYSIFLELGTGIYGPNKKRIVAKHGYPMRWEDDKGNEFHAWSTKGIKPQPFMMPAVKLVKPKMSFLYSENMAEFIAKARKIRKKN